MRRKRIRFLMRWALVLAVAGASAYGGYRYLLRRRVLAWREQGIAASRHGDHERAADLLVHYLQHRPRDIEALHCYVTSRELAELPNGQHVAEAIVGLRLLVHAEPTLENRRHLLRLYVRSERWLEALDTAEAILGETGPANVRGLVATGPRESAAWDKFPDDVGTLRLKVEALAGLRRYRDALETARKWSQVAPSDVEGHIARLSMRAQVGHEPAEIVADADEVCGAHPDDPGFELLRGFAHAQAYTIYSERGGELEATALAEAEMKAATQWLRKAGTHPGVSESLIETLVAQFDALGLVDDSVKVLREQERARASRELRHALGRRQWEAGRWPETLEALADVNGGDGGSDSTLVAMKAMALARTGKGPEAAESCSALASRKQPAARAWTALLPRLIDGAEVDDREVVKECRVALQYDPRNGYLACYLGDAYSRIGEADVAITAWKHASMVNPNWRVPALQLVEALVQKGRPEVAFEVARMMAKRSPNSSAAVISLARAWSAGVEADCVGDSDKLLKLVTDVQNVLPGEEQTLLIRIQLLAQKSDKHQAVQLARGAMSRTPPMDERLLLALARVGDKYGLGVEAECLSRCEQAHGRTPALAYAKALGEFAAGRAAQGLKLIDDWASKAEKDKEPAWKLVRARFLDASGNPGAVAAFSALADEYPKDASVQQAVLSAACVNAAARRGDWSASEKAIARLRDITGEKGLAWRLARAQLLVECPRKDADYEEGSVLLNDIVREFPQLAEAHALLAEALLRMKRTDGAIEQFSKAAAGMPNDSGLALELASLLLARGDADRARQELERIAPHLHAAAQRQQAAEMLAQLGQFRAALALLDGRPDQGPSGAGASDDAGGGRKPDFLRAMLYYNTQEFDKAESVVVRLLRQPDLTAVKFAANFYALRGRPADAETALGLLKGLKLDPGVAELTWADYYSRGGDLTRATEHYRSATRKAPGSAVAWRALANCQLLQGKADDAAATVDEAARAMPGDRAIAALKAMRDTVRDAGSDEGLRPLALLIVRDPLNSAEASELARTVVEARRANDAETLVGRLRQFVAKNPSFLPGRVQLIQANFAMGRAGEAIAAAQQAVTAFPGDAEVCKLAAGLCAAAQPPRWEEMQAVAQVWRKRTPDNPAPADVAIAGADIGMGRYEAAAAELRPYLAAAKAQPEPYAELLVTYCAALVNAGREKEATGVILPLAIKSAQWRARWTQVALGCGDPAMAAALLDRVGAILPSDALTERATLAAAYHRLGTGSGERQYLDRAAALYQSIADDPKASTAALVFAGCNAETRGDLTSAETLYRRALAADGRQWLVKNNLATVIARRGGDINEAVALAKAAAGAQPHLATVQDTLAMVQARAGNPAAAAQTMSTAVRLEPDNPVWRIRLAQYQLDAGNTAGARRTVAAIDAGRLSYAVEPELQRQLDSIRDKVNKPTFR